MISPGIHTNQTTARTTKIPAMTEHAAKRRHASTGSPQHGQRRLHVFRSAFHITGTAMSAVAIPTET
jgi:hypothetical protein